MDKSTRNMIQKATQDARGLLESEFSEQLSGIFDIRMDGTIEPKPGKHLDEKQKVMREKLVTAVEHEKAGGVSDFEAVTAYLREAAFTALNRFVALKMLEARGLVQECVSKGEQSSGFKEFCGLAPGLADFSDHGYWLYIESLFDELSTEIRVLFDRRDPASLLWPRRKAQEELLSILNREEIAGIWGEDETIGWVYQYFNSGEERKKMRDESDAPRNSRELAVRNQFFTPRYVVEFLTDNTLGRIWYEMMQGETRLKDICQYLVRRPNEVFLKEGDAPPDEDDKALENLSQEELFQKPHHIQFRVKKDPRDLKILDPACGSGHFLIYAFDLMERIYEEAWNDPNSSRSESTGRTLQEDYDSLEDLRQGIPKLIMEHNLFGIDIDHRAVQIATLALWLRAQKTWKNLNIKAVERPKVYRAFIVTAEPMPGEEDMKDEFIADLNPKVLGQFVDAVFSKMKLAGEAGALLKIEEEIKDVISKAKKQWLESSRPEQQHLFPGIGDLKAEQKEMQFDFKGLTDKRFWEHAENRILKALEDYSEATENGQTVRRRLFADDAARGFSFIDLCRKRYDVVLMNPPFGESSKEAFQILAKNYPYWNKNILCAFFERAKELMYADGAVGSIHDRTVLIKSTYEDFRRSTLLSDPSVSCLADLGWEVLDANVEVSSIVLRKKPIGTSTFYDVRGANKNIKARELLDKIEGVVTKDVWCVDPTEFVNLPNAVIGYDFKPYMLRSFTHEKSIRQRSLQAFTGSQLPKEPYFRLWWEPSKIEPKPFVRNIFKGGSFNAYVCSLRDVFIANVPFAELPTGSSTKIYNLNHYGKPGVAWGERGDWLCAYVLPKDCCFALEGPTIPVPYKSERLSLLGYLNTPIAREMINRICGQHKTSGYVNLLPYKPFKNLDIIAEKVKSAVYALILPRRLDETQLWFTGFETALSIHEVARALYDEISSAKGTSDLTQKHVHEACVQLYSLNKAESLELDDLIEALPNEAFPIEDVDYDQKCRWFAAHSCFSWSIGNIFGRWDIRYAINKLLSPELPDPFSPLPNCPPGMLIGPDRLPAESGCIASEEWLFVRPGTNIQATEGAIKDATIPDSKYPLRISWDGILVDDPGFEGNQLHDKDIETRIREVVDALWGEKAQTIDTELCKILKVPDLRTYCRKLFFQDHIKRYTKSRRKAPIYWQLSTPSASYSIWLYYHRFTKDTFYQVLNEYVAPKLQFEERELEKIRQKYGPDPTSGQRKQLDARETFVSELKTFKGEVALIAPLWNPDLNDGVIINFAPLWRLAPQNKTWQKECKKVWDKLVKGDYDWAHLAMHLWPERVVPKCIKDRSLSIAHGMEGAFWEEDEDGKWRSKKVSQETKKALIHKHTSPTVKAALEDLINAPVPASTNRKRRKKKA